MTKSWKTPWSSMNNIFARIKVLHFTPKLSFELYLTSGKSILSVSLLISFL